MGDRISRRDFLKRSAALGAGASLVAPLRLLAAGPGEKAVSTLRVGGGRQQPARDLAVRALDPVLERALAARREDAMQVTVVIEQVRARPGAGRRAQHGGRDRDCQEITTSPHRGPPFMPSGSRPRLRRRS